MALQSYAHVDDGEPDVGTGAGIKKTDFRFTEGVQTDSDLVLVSSDKFQFQIHRRDLLVFPHTFKDMLESIDDGSSGSASSPKIPMSESSHLLGLLLPCFYPLMPAPCLLSSKEELSATTTYIKILSFCGRYKPDETVEKTLLAQLTYVIRNTIAVLHDKDTILLQSFRRRELLLSLQGTRLLSHYSKPRRCRAAGPTLHSGSFGRR